MNWHYKLQLNLQMNPSPRFKVVSIDLEWAKNWHAEEKLVPFCFAAHSVYIPPTAAGALTEVNTLRMTADLLFRAPTETTSQFLRRVDIAIQDQIDEGVVVLVGHQVSSDLHCMKQTAGIRLPTVERLIALFRLRKELAVANSNCKVFDTRYDIAQRVVGQEKLRDVSLRLGVYAIQFELSAKLSLTKLYNTYGLTLNNDARERLSVLNWRHALQTALVYLVDQHDLSVPLCGYITTNDVMYQMGHGKIKYLEHEDYRYSNSDAGIRTYLAIHWPKGRQARNVSRVGVRADVRSQSARPGRH